MNRLICPICEKPFDAHLSPAMPFCSQRCRQIDLGRWLKESYGLPWQPRDAPDVEDAYDVPPDSADRDEASGAE